MLYLVYYWLFFIDGVRQRKTDAGSDSPEDLDAMIKYHNQQQEKVAEEMVHLAKSMKENAMTAGRIVREDTKVGVTLDKVIRNNMKRIITEKETAIDELI